MSLLASTLAPLSTMALAVLSYRPTTVAALTAMALVASSSGEMTLSARVWSLAVRSASTSRSFLDFNTAWLPTVAMTSFWTSEKATETATLTSVLAPLRESALLL